MKNILLFISLLILILPSCTDNKNVETEKFQKHRDNIIDVSDKIVNIDPKIIIGRSFMKIIGDYLVVSEYQNFDRGIHIYNKNTLEYIASTGIIGRGPGEITRIGFLVSDFDNNSFWAADFEKKVMWKFSMDSIFKNPIYKPSDKLELNDDLFIDRFSFVNDSIALGKGTRVLSVSSFDMTMAKLNINTNTTQKFGYEHPDATGKGSNSFFGLSEENNIYVNAFAFLDLITICDIDGNLKCNIYGPEWSENYREPMAYFGQVGFYGKNIIVDYTGEPDMVYDSNRIPLHGSFPSKLMFFDMDGNYNYTYEIGNQFSDFCVDEENNRIIIFFWDRENEMGYLDLNSVK